MARLPVWKAPRSPRPRRDPVPAPVPEGFLEALSAEPDGCCCGRPADDPNRCLCPEAGDAQVDCCCTAD